MSNDTKLTKLLDQLKKCNYKKTIKIRVKKNRTDSYSLYYDIWHNGKREYRFLKYYLFPNKPFENEQTIREVIAIRDKEEQELIRLDNNYTLVNWKNKTDFIDYANAIVKDKKDWVLISVMKLLSEYTNGSLAFNQIDERFLEGFKTFLLGKVQPITTWNYLNKLRAVLNKSIRDKILTTNPASNIRVSKNTADRQFLTIEERNLLIETPCKHNTVKDAFLFSCFTGLRLSDIESLTWDNIQGDYISIKMQKTKEPIRIKLHIEALKILDRQDHAHNIVFSKLPSRPHITKHIVTWTADAGITKHITFHCARHTFATSLLTSEIDLYTVSKLLGHGDIATTQVYAKIVDSVKDDAIDKLR